MVATCSRSRNWYCRSMSPGGDKSMARSRKGPRLSHSGIGRGVRKNAAYLRIADCGMRSSKSGPPELGSALICAWYFFPRSLGIRTKCCRTGEIVGCATFRRRDADGRDRDGRAPRKVAYDWGFSRPAKKRWTIPRHLRNCGLAFSREQSVGIQRKGAREKADDVGRPLASTKP